jgi:hypothetical protein
MLRNFTILLFFGAFSLNAQAIVIDPINCGGSLTCYTTNDTGNLGNWADIETAFGVSVDPDLTLSYKNNVGGGEDGTFASSYSTTYNNTPMDPADADIAYDAGASISCPECWLLVKDGVASPAQYLIEISSWNGTDTLELRNFWPTNGAISHVEIWGNVSPVPVPAAVWLFGTALIGFIGFSRRTKV